MKVVRKLLESAGFGPSPIPLRWRVRWFLRGMGSILVPLTAEEMREEVDRCVEARMRKWREENPEPSGVPTFDVPVDQ